MFIVNLFKGFLYGIFSITPGLSAGIIANSLGDYKKCLEIITDGKKIIDNISYLLFITAGFIFGTIICSNLISYLYKSFYIFFLFFVLLINIFIFFINEKKKKHSISIYLRNIVIIIVLILFIYVFNSIFYIRNEIILYIISGIMYSFSKIVPGVSSTSILISIGFYDDLLSFLSNPFSSFLKKTLTWFLFWSSFIISSILLLKIIYYLIIKNFFDKFIQLILLLNIFLLLFSI